MNNLIKQGVLVAFMGASALAAPTTALAQTNQQLADQIQVLQAQIQALQAKTARVDTMPTPPPALNPNAAKEAETNTQPGGDGVPVLAKGATLNLGGFKITPGGFIAAEAVYRTRAEAADINSDFKGYPFPNNNNHQIGEFRPTARQSRVQLLVEAPNVSNNKVEGFIAADFQGSGTTSNQNQSNSYVPRVREAYATWARKDLDFYVLAGQSWSMATMFRKGLTPRTEVTPLTIDSQYVVGFNWLRVPQLRIVKNFGNVVAAGISFESPQNQIKGTAPAGELATNTGDNAGLLNNTTTYSTDVAPDITGKVAIDPGYGHYEISGTTRFLHNRSEATPGTLSTESTHTTVAQSFGVGVMLPLVPKMVDFQFSGMLGKGAGRYASGQLGDSTYNTVNGHVAALTGQSALAGLIVHPTTTLDMYAYGGMEHLKGGYGYGNGTVATYNGCNQDYSTGTQTAAGVITAPACANGNLAFAREVTAGYWWKFYKGPIGYLSNGLQFAYNRIDTFNGRDGSKGKTNDTGVWLSFRYYPYQ